MSANDPKRHQAVFSLKSTFCLERTREAHDSGTTLIERVEKEGPSSLERSDTRLAYGHCPRSSVGNIAVSKAIDLAKRDLQVAG